MAFSDTSGIRHQNPKLILSVRRMGLLSVLEPTRGPENDQLQYHVPIDPTRHPRRPAPRHGLVKTPRRTMRLGRLQRGRQIQRTQV